jgi:hypothetical protein
MPSEYMTMSEQSTMMAVMAALAIGCIHCGGRSSLEVDAATQDAADAAVRTPQSLAGLVLWLDGTRGVQTSGEAVTSWDDQSGLKNDATPSATGSSDPVFVAKAIGTAPAVRFDGTNYLVIQDDASLQFGTGDFLVAVVARHTTPIHVGWGYGFFYNKAELALPFAGPALVANTEEGTTQIAAQITYHQAIIETAQSGLNDGQPMVLVMRRRASPGLASLEIRLNGATSAISTGSTYATDVSAPGRPVFLGGTPNMQDIVGDVAEVVAVKGATPDADVTALEGYLATKYGL